MYKREINVYISGGWDVYPSQAPATSSSSSSSSLRDAFITHVCKPIEDMCLRRRISFSLVDFRNGGKNGRRDLLDLRLQVPLQPPPKL